MLEDHVNAVLSAPIEELPAQYTAAVAPVLTAATVFTSGQAVIVACPTMNQVCFGG